MDAILTARLFLTLKRTADEVKAQIHKPAEETPPPLPKVKKLVPKFVPFFSQ
jgi:hypothetical protein